MSNVVEEALPKEGMVMVDIRLASELIIHGPVEAARARAGWGLQPGKIYDLWEVESEEPLTLRPWAKWHVTENGEVVALRIPSGDSQCGWELHEGSDIP
jgi:hypothetical protein